MNECVYEKNSVGRSVQIKYVVKFTIQAFVELKESCERNRVG